MKTLEKSFSEITEIQPEMENLRPEAVQIHEMIKKHRKIHGEPVPQEQEPVDSFLRELARQHEKLSDEVRVMLYYHPVLGKAETGSP